MPGVRERVLTEGSSSLFFLPLSHILARVVALCLVHAGKRIGFLSDPGELPVELAAFRPTILLAVPRVFEKVAAAAREQAEAQGHQRLFAAAEAAAIDYSRAGRAGMLLRLRHAVFGRLVYARLRAALGGQAAWAISGGAPLNQELGHFLRGAGITIMEGWGLTETTGPVTMNRPEVQRIGSVGLPLPGCAVRIAPDGEVEARGPIVFQGYWQDQQATREAFDRRWLRTGDLGRQDDDGYLYITGRKKDLIITAGGKNVAPEVLEDRLREHWLIEECVVVGDQRPYIAALVTLDQAAFARWKRRLLVHVDSRDALVHHFHLRGHLLQRHPPTDGNRRAARQSPGQYRRLTHAHAAATGVTRQGAPAPISTTASNGPNANGDDGRHATKIRTVRPAIHHPVTEKTPASYDPHAAAGARDPLSAPHGRATQWLMISLLLTRPRARAERASVNSRPARRT